MSTPVLADVKILDMAKCVDNGTSNLYVPQRKLGVRMHGVPKAHELDDGTPEVVDRYPQRRTPVTAAVADVAALRPNANLEAFRAAGDSGRREFVLIRTPAGAAKIAFTHVPVFATIVRLWMARRAEGAADPGVSPREVSEAMGVPPTSLQNVFVSLRRNEMIRSKVTHVGYQGVRAKYYPTEAGAQALAIAELLGPSSLVMVGGQVNAWKGRNMSEPPNLFHFAALMRKSRREARGA